MRRFAGTFWSLLIMGLASPRAQATHDQNYGPGGVSTGRVGGVLADTEQPFAALLNPATLPHQTQPLFAFSTSFSRSDFAPLSQVLVDSPQYRTREAIRRQEDFAPPSTAASLWTAGFTYPFRLPRYLKRQAGIGVVASGPYGKLRSFSSGTPYDFNVLRYGATDSQFKGTIATGFEIFPKSLSVGLGVSLFITAGGSADARIVENQPTGRLNLDVGLNTNLLAGLYLPLETGNLRHATSLVYRQEANPQFRQEFEGSIQVREGTETVTLPITLQTTLYFEPKTIEWEWQTKFPTAWKVAVGVAYQIWSEYQPSYLIVEAPSRDGGTAKTQIPPLNLRNTWNPRLSFDFPIYQERCRIGFGYQFRPSPVQDLSQETNLLDSSIHVVGASLTYRIPDNEIIPLPLTLGVHGQFHQISRRVVEKTSSTYIGAPGYQFSGNAYLYGVQLQADL